MSIFQFSGCSTDVLKAICYAYVSTSALFFEWHRRAAYLPYKERKQFETNMTAVNSKFSYISYGTDNDSDSKIPWHLG